MSEIYPGWGRDKEGTRQTVSPGMASASRLVVNISKDSHESSKDTASWAQAATRCSQLSSTSKVRVEQRAFVNVSIQGTFGTSTNPSALATAWGTRAGSARVTR